MPSSDTYALVVDPIMDGYRFSKVIMDGGSSINILYAYTLKAMKSSRSSFGAARQPSTTSYPVDRQGPWVR